MPFSCLFRRPKQEKDHPQRDEEHHRRVDRALCAQIRQRVINVAAQAHRRAAVIKQVLDEVDLHAGAQRPVGRQIRRYRRADQQRAQQHPPCRSQRAAKTFPPPHKRQQADPQPREQPDIRVFDEENPARRRAEAQRAPSVRFPWPHHQRQRQIHARRQRGEREFSALPPCVNAVQQQTTAARIGMLSSVSRPLAEERNRPPARVNHRREAQRLQNEHADEARIRNRRPQRVEHEQQRPLVVKQIAIGHQPARHAAPDGEIDVRIRPKIGGVQRRAGRRNQQRQRRAEQRQQRGERPFHSLFLLYRYSVLFSRLSSS